MGSLSLRSIRYLAASALAFALPLAAAAQYAEPAAPASPGPAASRPYGEPPPLKLVFQMSGDFGQTWIVKAQLVNSETGDTSSQTLYLNAGFGMSVGAAFLPLLDGLLNTQATVGFEGGEISASNGKATWLAFPLEVMEFVNLGPVRAGAGLSYLLSSRVRGYEFFEGYDFDFDPSAGFIMEADWTGVSEHHPRKPRFWLGLRYEIQPLVDQYGNRWDADAWGIVTGLAW